MSLNRGKKLMFIEDYSVLDMKSMMEDADGDADTGLYT